MTEHLVVITTVGGREEAVVLARALLERRLVACVNLVPGIRSLYRWKGEIADDTEQMLVMKTRADRYPALAAAVSELHPYDVPELVALAVENGSEAYLAWIDDSLGDFDGLKRGSPGKSE
jgi:periplasmic divalent cation tolerance protein